MTTKSTYFTEIVGLRIYLALWVAIGHGLQLAGFLKGTNPLQRLFLRTDDAVILFMIVSGFVITNLLLTKHENYSSYITRRFFRLFPAYVLACIAGYFLIDGWVKIATITPWATQPAAIEYAKGIYQLRDQMTNNILPHLIAHAVMLHGLIPDEILLRAPMTFLPAAWSISLEWQFYLIAPLIMMMMQSSVRTILLIAISLGLFLAFKGRVLGHYSINSTIAANTQYFLLGMVSRLMYERLAAVSASPLLGAAIAAFIGAVAIRNPLPFIIWGAFYSYSLWHRHASFTGVVFRTLTQAKPFQVMGEASYSLYLIHRPLQVAVVLLLIGMVPLTHYSVMAMQLMAIVIALPLSVLIYFTIERWGIRLGHKLATRLGTKRQPPPAFSAPPSDALVS